MGVFVWILRTARVQFVPASSSQESWRSELRVATAVRYLLRPRAVSAMWHLVLTMRCLVLTKPRTTTPKNTEKLALQTTCTRSPRLGTAGSVGEAAHGDGACGGGDGAEGCGVEGCGCKAADPPEGPRGRRA
eukprot:3902491-Rhodomonas_salina.1